MAPRLNKRQQREQEELLALGGRAASPDAESSGGDDELDPAVALPAKTKKSQAGFAAVSSSVVSVRSMIVDGKTSLWQQTDLETRMKMRAGRKEQDR